jgi:outer membrane protein assembly factor BamB
MSDLNTGAVVWSTGGSAAVPRLSFGHDGNLVIFDDHGVRRPVWWSNRNACRDYEWLPGKVFQPDEHYVTCTGAMFAMQATDGNVVRVNPDGQVVWASNVAVPGGHMEFRTGDGKLVITDSAGQLVWTSPVGAPGGKLVLRPTGPSDSSMPRVTESGASVRRSRRRTGRPHDA